MQTRRLPGVLTAVAAAALVLGAVPATAVAQTGPSPRPECQTTDVVYPPGTCPGEPRPRRGVSDDNPQPGEMLSASSGAGSFDPGTPAEYGVQSKYIRLGETTVGPTGSADVRFAVPTTLSRGQHHVVFKGRKNGKPATVRVPFFVAGAAPVTPREPDKVGWGRKGSDYLLPAGATGVALAGVALLALRRRRELDAEEV